MRGGSTARWSLGRSLARLHVSGIDPFAPIHNRHRVASVCLSVCLYLRLSVCLRVSVGRHGVAALALFQRQIANISRRRVGQRVAYIRASLLHAGKRTASSMHVDVSVQLTFATCTTSYTGRRGPNFIARAVHYELMNYAPLYTVSQKRPTFSLL